MKLLFTIIILLQLATLKTSAQGCSDAGFCSIKYHIKTNKNIAKENSFSIGNILGLADKNVSVNNTYINANIKLYNDLFLDTKINAIYASGNLGTNFNIGDITTTLQYGAYSNSQTNTSVSIGAGIKIPLSGANNKINGAPAPMHYQSTLGTTDVLAGISIIKNKWEVVTGVQIPLTTNNNNTFLTTNTANNKYINTNKFERKSDVILKLAYQTNKALKKIYLKTSLVCIYHTAQDSYINNLNQRIKIANSNGPNVNVLLTANYDISDVKGLKFIVSTPSFINNVRADGLRRNFAFGAEYRISF